MRHHHGRLDATTHRGVTERAGMITGGMCGNAFRRLGIGQAEHGIHGAARLERAHLLQVFALEKKFSAA
jgi:hypothetical protein